MDENLRIAFFSILFQNSHLSTDFCVGFGQSPKDAHLPKFMLVRSISWTTIGEKQNGSRQRNKSSPYRSSSLLRQLSGTYSVWTSVMNGTNWGMTLYWSHRGWACYDTLGTVQLSLRDAKDDDDETESSSTSVPSLLRWWFLVLFLFSCQTDLMS